MDQTTPVRDWFLGAIEANGSVRKCLQTVQSELQIKQDFIAALLNSLQPYDHDQVDTLTLLDQQLRLFSSTLHVRLGLLSPEREIAWFRRSTTHTVGPFASSIFQDPVFFPYESARADLVAGSLKESFKSRSLSSILHAPPHESSESQHCLWSRLLWLNHSLEAYSVFPWQGGIFRLDQVPQDPIPHLESKPLRAFLLNVQNEIRSLRQQLDQAFDALLKASETLWHFQRKKKPRTGSARCEPQPPPKSSSPATRLFPARERAALRFMGFEDLPDHPTLRRRYLELAKKLHPDVISGQDEEFKILIESYRCLQKTLDT